MDGLIATPTKDLAWQLRRPFEPLLSLLLELERHGFIVMLIDDVSTMCALREQNVSPETEAETETETEGEERASAPPPGVDKSKRRARGLPTDWAPNAEHEAIAKERGVSLEGEAVKMRDWALANGETKKDWDATFRNWLRRADPPRTAAPRPYGDETQRDADRAREARERAAQRAADERRQADEAAARDVDNLRAWFATLDHEQRHEIQSEVARRLEGLGSTKDAIRKGIQMGVMFEFYKRATQPSGGFAA